MSDEDRLLMVRTQLFAAAYFAQLPVNDLVSALHCPPESSLRRLLDSAFDEAAKVADKMAPEVLRRLTEAR